MFGRGRGRAPRPSQRALITPPAAAAARARDAFTPSQTPRRSGESATASLLVSRARPRMPSLFSKGWSASSRSIQARERPRGGRAARGHSAWFDACAGQLTRACVDLAKAWRTDKYLRRLEVPATARLLGAKARSIHVAPRGLIAGRAARGGQERVFRAHGKRRRAGAKRWHHG